MPSSASGNEPDSPELESGRDGGPDVTPSPKPSSELAEKEWYCRAAFRDGAAPRCEAVDLLSEAREWEADAGLGPTWVVGAVEPRPACPDADSKAELELDDALAEEILRGPALMTPALRRETCRLRARTTSTQLVGKILITRCVPRVNQNVRVLRKCCCPPGR